jgi:hypothetical protein
MAHDTSDRSLTVNQRGVERYYASPREIVSVQFGKGRHGSLYLNKCLIARGQFSGRESVR